MATTGATIGHDPRGHIDAAHLWSQFDLAHRIWSNHDETNNAVNAIRKARDEIAAWAGGAKEVGNADEVVDLAQSITARLDAMEGDLPQREIQIEQCSLSYPSQVEFQTGETYLGSQLRHACSHAGSSRAF